MMKTVYVFLADGFEEIEAFTVVDVLRRAGANVVMISTTPYEIVTGAHEISVLCDEQLAKCNFSDAAMIVLPGGMPGADSLEKCEALCSLILQCAKENKAIAAICAAPMILGKLGLLKGKKATCYSSFEQYLNGAEFTGAAVEKDGNIITANSPAAALEFALTLVDHLLGKEKVEELKEAILIP